jgi:hypothetical protein
MKLSTIAKWGVAVLVTALALGFMACPGDPGGGDPIKSDAAELTALSVAGTDVTTIPEAIDGADWDGRSSMTGLDAAKSGNVTVTNSSALEATEIVATASAGAQVAYTTGTGNGKPTVSFENLTAATTPRITAATWLYLRVTSESGAVVNYYRVQVNTLSTSAVVQTVSIANTAALPGSRSATWPPSGPGSIELSKSNNTNVNIVISTSSPTTTINYAYVTDKSTAEPTWTTLAQGGAIPAVATMNHGDYLGIKVVSQDGSNTAYYKIEILVGTNALLTSVKIGETTTTNLGTPKETWDDAGLVRGQYLGQDRVAPSGSSLSIAITPQDSLAKVSYAYSSPGVLTSNPTYTALTSNSGSHNFFAEGFLYLEVTSENGEVKMYYTIRASMRQSVGLQYGMPDIENGVIDPVWDSVTEVMMIQRLFEGDNEGDAEYLANVTAHTIGRAKALWDDDGLYLYIDVDDDDLSPMDANLTNNNAHRYDSVEIFVNEAKSMASVADSAAFGRAGSQYRVGMTGHISGNSTVGNPDAIGAMEALNNYSAWTKKANGDPWIEGTDAANLATGYIVIAQVPWRFKTGANKVDMFDENGLVKDNVEIGFELQINACNTPGQRWATLCWNNSATTNYQNASNYGVATLAPPSGARITKAEMPSITQQPRGSMYSTSMTTTDLQPITVGIAAFTSSTATASYQWYKGAATGEGTTVGTDSASFVPDVTLSTEGATYYWVVITNTDTGASSGYQTRTVTSRRVRINVVAPVDYIPDLSFTFDPGDAKSVLMAASSNYAAAVTIELENLEGFEDFDITKYNWFRFEIKVTKDTNGTEDEVDSTGTGGVQMKWGGTSNVDMYDINKVDAREIPAAAKEAAPISKLIFETRATSNWTALVGAGGGYIEVVSIAFTVEAP